MKIYDGDTGKVRTIEISIQDMSQYHGERVKLGQGSYSHSSVANVLALKAFDNALDPKRNNMIDFTDGKEGKFIKIYNVPYIKRSEDKVLLEIRPGGVTKIDGETVYLQKEDKKGYSWNYSGVLMGLPIVKSVVAAKEKLPSIKEEIERFKRKNMLSSPMGQLILLNKNHGMVDINIWKAFDTKDFEEIARVVSTENSTIFSS